MFGNIYGNVDFYKNALDGTWDRHKAISSNISNVNTPDYKRKYTSFEEQLKDKNDERKLKLDTTHSKHIGQKNTNFKPKTLKDRSGSYRVDGNNVDIDVESTNLAKNNIMYDAITRQLSGEFEKIKNVITEGSK